jgi:hypothetical protein
LKKKKDELQLASIRAAVNMLIEEDHITKDQCVDIIKRALEVIGKDQYFN